MSRNGHIERSNGTSNSMKAVFTVPESSEPWIRSAHQEHPVSCVAFNLQGTKMATGYSKGNIEVWSSWRGSSESTSLLGHSKAVEAIRWSPVDSAVLASISSDKTLKLWDGIMGKLTLTLTLDAEPVNLHWSRDGKIILVGDKSDTLSIINMDTQLIKSKFKLPDIDELQSTTQINQFTLTKDLKKLIITSNNGHVHFFNLENFEFLKTIRISVSTCHSLDLHPSGNYVCVGTADSTASLIDLRNLNIVANYSDLDLTVRSIRFNSDGKYLAMCSRQSTVYIYNTYTGYLVGELETLNELNSLAWNHDRNLLACVGDQVEENRAPTGMIFLFDLEKFLKETPRN